MQKSNQARELALLCAPILIIGAAAALITASSRREAERKSGPLRTVIQSVNLRKTTPLEAWRGFDWGIAIDYRIDGAPNWTPGMQPANLWTPDVNWMGLNPVKVGIRSYGQDAMQADFVVKSRDAAPPSQSITGNLGASNTAWSKLSTPNLPEKRSAKSSAFKFEIPTGANRADEVDSTAPSVFWVKATPKTVMTAGIEISARVSPPYWRDHGGNKWSCQNVRITDENKRAIPNLSNVGLGNRQFLTDGSAIFRAFVPLAQLPKNRGRLNYEAWLSCENSWPVKISCDF